MSCKNNNILTRLWNLVSVIIMFPVRIISLFIRGIGYLCHMIIQLIIPKNSQKRDNIRLRMGDLEESFQDMETSQDRYSERLDTQENDIKKISIKLDVQEHSLKQRIKDSEKHERKIEHLRERIKCKVSKEICKSKNEKCKSKNEKCKK